MRPPYLLRESVAKIPNPSVRLCVAMMRGTVNRVTEGLLEKRNVHNMSAPAPPVSPPNRSFFSCRYWNASIIHYQTVPVRRLYCPDVLSLVSCGRFRHPASARSFEHRLYHGPHSWLTVLRRLDVGHFTGRQTDIQDRLQP